MESEFLNKLKVEKWQKFLRRVKVFRFVPFIDFVLAAGSLATGKLHEKSDFDVILSVRSGRIFTARFFAVVFSDLFGFRRKGTDHKEEAADKLCLNHFVTREAYCLKPPYNAYWNDLYQKLVPVMGDEKAISDFFKANDWLRPPRQYPASPSGLRGVSERDSRYLGRGKSFIKSISEFIFRGWLGNKLEQVLKKLQLRRIERALPQALGYKPRFIASDLELEFHMDTKRIEEMLLL